MTSRFLLFPMGCSGILIDCRWISLPGHMWDHQDGNLLGLLDHVSFRPCVCVFLNINVYVWGGGGVGGCSSFLRSRRQQRDAFLDLTEYESVQKSDGWRLGARYSSLHFVDLHQMQHFSPMSSFTCTGPKAADWFCTLCHLFHLVTPFGVTFSPLCGLCLESTVTSWSVYRAPAPSVFCFFSI